MFFIPSTSSVVKGPLYFIFAMSSQDGLWSSQYIKAICLTSTLCFAANFSIPHTAFNGLLLCGSIISLRQAAKFK